MCHLSLLLEMPAAQALQPNMARALYAPLSLLDLMGSQTSIIDCITADLIALSAADGCSHHMWSQSHPAK